MSAVRSAPPSTTRVAIAWILALSLACGAEPDAPAAEPAPAAQAGASDEAGDPADQARRDQAAELVARFQERLQGELQAAMKAGGPAHAIGVCAERAPAVAAELSLDGPTIRRLGTRARNPGNTPTAAERALLERLAGGESRLLAELDGRPVALHAIRIENPVCLNCHGPADALLPEVRDQLASHYPDDRATGYALGDLRGAFVVEWPESTRAR